MTLAYFDCFAGAGGDMIVGALLDAGAEAATVADALGRLDLPGCSVRHETVRRAGMAGVEFHVDVTGDDHPHRHLESILALIDGAALPQRAADRARRIFTRLARAEADVHGIDVQKVHFHEVGAVDSIVDIVAACVAMELLGVDRVLCSPIAMGSGTITCEHGTLPAPAPATARLVEGAEVFSPGIDGEATTPTAAAVLTTLAESYGPMPAMTVAAVGCGAGTRDAGPLPNLLRVFVGSPGEGTVDDAVELAANIDDCSGEIIGATVEALLAAGCLDAWATPIVMKKSRPAWTLVALCAPGDVAAAQRIIFTETTTFGIRSRPCRRSKLVRELATVETACGPIRIKIGLLDGKVVTASPEFDDCKAAAQSHHVAIKDVYARAVRAWNDQGAGQ